jgi:hypothetical protein
MSGLYSRHRFKAAGFLTGGLVTLLCHSGLAAPWLATIDDVTPRAGRAAPALRAARVYRVGAAGRVRSHGQAPAGARLTTAPGITVRSLAPHRALAGRKIDEFDVSPRGSIVVRIGGMLYDFASGRALTSAGPPVCSFAFVQGALAAVIRYETLAFWKAGALREAGKVPHGARRLRSSESGHELLLIGDTPDSGVFRFSAAAGLRPVCSAPARILTAAGEGDHCLVAMGTSLYEVSEADGPLPPGTLSLRMSLPSGKGQIVGLALAGDVTYFATPEAVSSLQGGLGIPLAIGIGGPLRMTSRGLLVLHRKTGQLFRISGAGLTAPGRATATRRRSPVAAGTLKLTLAHADGEYGSPGYTIYMDGRILARFDGEAPSRRQNPRRLRLPAGRHRVDAAITLGTRPMDVHFPFRFRSAEVVVPAGGVAAVTLDVQTGYEGAMALSGYPEEGPSASWFEGWLQSVRETRGRVSEDPVAAALMEAGHRSDWPASAKGRVWLELPQDFGGAREYDADQVRMIAAWLQRYHWSWASRLPDDFVRRMSGEMRAEYESVLEQIEREKAFLAELADVACRRR